MSTPADELTRLRADNRDLRHRLGKIHNLMRIASDARTIENAQHSIKMALELASVVKLTFPFDE